MFQTTNQIYIKSWIKLKGLPFLVESWILYQRQRETPRAFTPLARVVTTTGA